ncbi:MAG: methionyl-tRNA formyltransferase, partial [Candidatus Kerfeldbacteria bacterium]|nr:methionyl-tRNA formyltransferase [Candidatus Kerfeldbacteria bacterium]
PPFVYYGTSDFSAIILSGLLQAGLQPSLVVSTEPKPAGRGLKLTPTPVSWLAQDKKLPLLEVKTLKPEDIQKQLADSATPLAILAAFGKIIPQNVLDIYPKGIVNVHPSLLPLYRGPAPIQYALRDGQTETGVSLIVLDEQVDHGPMLAQEKCRVAETDDTLTLSQKLAELSVKLLLSSLDHYLDGSISPVPQVHSRATFTKMITRADGQADFSKSALELDRQRRAFTPWPALWTRWQDKRLRLLETAVVDYKCEAKKVIMNGSQLIIGCGSGSLVVKLLQLEGGRALSAADFIRGHKDFINSTL